MHFESDKRVCAMSKMITEQSAFLADVCKLITFIKQHGKYVAVTGGEVYRTQEQQQIYFNNGKSKTMNSMHCKRLAIDLNVFICEDGKAKLTYDKDDLQAIGNYWESLNIKNRWGGNWKSFVDTPHFERTV